MTEKGQVTVGCWVSFLLRGQIVYAKVEYIRPRSSWERSDHAITTLGEVQVDYVLEVR